MATMEKEGITPLAIHPLTGEPVTGMGRQFCVDGIRVRAR